MYYVKRGAIELKKIKMNMKLLKHFVTFFHFFFDLQYASMQ